jgi:hypothetical protein
MSRSRTVRSSLLIVGAGMLVTAAVLPAGALAHGLVGKQDLPIPRWLFAWAAAIVLVVSFVALGALWVRPRWEGGFRTRAVLELPAGLEPLCGAIGIAIFCAGVYAGLAGSQEAIDNLLPTLIYVLFWVGIPFASVLCGDVFRCFNPWLAVGRGAGWLTRRVAGASVPEPLPYPARLGRWPAVVGIFGFAWLELVYADKDDPRKLAVLALLYAVVQLVAMSIFGAEAWSRRGDAFSVYFNLFARLSPLRWRRRRLELQPPLAGITALRPVPGTVALLCVMIGSTGFDGFSQGQIWNGAGNRGLAGALNDFFHQTLGLGIERALEAAFTVGLLLMIGLVAAVYCIGVIGMSTVGPTPPPELARRFVHTLVPIALAYVVAHYFSLFAYQGQALAYLVSDPLGDGANLFGTASATIDYGVITATGVWYVQVAALVIGHVSGLTLAHDRALGTFSDVKVAVRSQYWMLTVMVGFTSLGLFLLSDAA